MCVVFHVMWTDFGPFISLISKRKLKYKKKECQMVLSKL